MSTPQEIAQKAIELVSTSPGREVIGARLGALIKVSFPDFSPIKYQAKNFRQFIRLYAPSLTERPHSAGVDVLFTVADSTASALTTMAPPVSEFRPHGFTKLPLDLLTWRVYSNPSNRRSIALNPSTREIKAIDPEAHVSAPWSIIPKPTPERHLELARAFSASQQAQVQVPLERVLALPNWYMQFSAVAKRMNVGSAWASYRITKLSADLEASLLAFDTPINALKLSREAMNEISIAAPVPFSANVDGLAEAEARKLAVKAIQGMPIAELRDLKFSLGSILDALASK